MIQSAMVLNHIAGIYLTCSYYNIIIATSTISITIKLHIKIFYATRIRK